MNLSALFARFFAIGALGAASVIGASAEDWQSFGVRKANFVFDVPAELSLKELAKNGAGASFVGPSEATLTVLGDTLALRDFRADVSQRLKEDQKSGWEISYRRITARWASYSGIRDGFIRYFRAIKICRDRLAVFWLDYPQDDKVAFDPVVRRMVRSLKSQGC